MYFVWKRAGGRGEGLRSVRARVDHVSKREVELVLRVNAHRHMRASFKEKGGKMVGI